MSQPPRRSRGFRHAASLVAKPVQAVAEGRGFAVSRLLTQWPEIVGAEIAARARPVKIGHSRGGMGATLTLLTTGPFAPLIEMQLPKIRERVNACYGYNAISRIRVTQSSASGFAEGQARFEPAPPKPAAPSPETRRAAEALVPDITDPALRAAIARLAVLNLSRRDKTNNRKAI